MKFLIQLTLILSLFSCCNNTSKRGINNKNSNNAIPVIEFSERIIDLGNLSNDTTIQATFYVRNVGLEKLIIKGIDMECSCTSYELENKMVLPGDSTKLMIKYNTTGKAPGFQRSAIIVESNTEKEFNTIFIRCNIKRKVLVSNG